MYFLIFVVVRDSFVVAAAADGDDGNFIFRFSSSFYFSLFYLIEIHASYCSLKLNSNLLDTLMSSFSLRKVFASFKVNENQA